MKGCPVKNDLYRRCPDCFGVFQHEPGCPEIHVRNQTPEPLYYRKPDASMRRCLDCSYCRHNPEAVTTRQCVNDDAIEKRQTRIPGIYDCEFWAPAPWPNPDIPVPSVRIIEDELPPVKITSTHIEIMKGVFLPTGIPPCPECGGDVGISRHSWFVFTGWEHWGGRADTSMIFAAEDCGHTWGLYFYAARTAARLRRLSDYLTGAVRCRKCGVRLPHIERIMTRRSRRHIQANGLAKCPDGCPTPEPG